jgi:hypothetical protein
MTRTSHAFGESITCLSCGYVFDSASGLEDAQGKKPHDGDVSVCIRCGELAIFTADVEGEVATGLRYPTTEEMDELMSNEAIVRARAAVILTVQLMDRPPREVWPKIR